MKQSLVLLLAGMCWTGLSLWASPPTRSEGKPDTATVVSQSRKAVVQVVVSDSSGKPLAQGSGFIVSIDGKVVTNYHVVKGARSGVIKLPTGAMYFIKGVLAEDRKRDLVILKVDGEDFPELPIGESDKTQIGDEVIAIGSPLALESTVSNGIVSAIREIADVKLIQTTAALSPGSSGGALLNMKGEAIGITTFQFAGGQNLNFAVASVHLLPLLKIDNLRPLLFGADSDQPPLAAEKFPTIWTSTLEKTQWRYRFDRDFVYASLIPTPQQETDGIYVRCEYKRSRDRWVGTCNYSLYCSGFLAPKKCSLVLEDTITLLSDMRIEGEGLYWDKIDCGKCRPKATHLAKWAHIPEDQ